MLRLLKSSGMNGVALEDVNSCGTKEQRNEKKRKERQNENENKTGFVQPFLDLRYMVLKLIVLTKTGSGQMQASLLNKRTLTHSLTHRVVAN
jgi:hypothetical protein